MKKSHGLPALVGMMGLVVVTLGAPDAVSAQGRGRGRGGGGGGGDDDRPTVTVAASISISLGDRERILAFYAASPPPGLQALPPGIRRNLERGKPVPPGIARRSLPDGLRSQITVREGFEIVEVGLDVLLVEIATGVVHDVLMDIVR